VLNGEEQEAGYYSRNTPAAAAYFDNDRVIIKVGNLELVPVENITISGPSKVAVGADAQLTPLVTPSNAEQRVTWSVEPAGMATISESGLLTSGSASGCITVKATATDESGVFGTKEIAIGDATCGSSTAVEAEDLATLTVTPNPVQSALNIADEKVIGEVRIYTLTSTLVKAATLNAKAATIDVSSLPAGAYLVVVSYTNTDKKAAKLIVKN
jgi:hypothetical protein